MSPIGSERKVKRVFIPPKPDIYSLLLIFSSAFLMGGIVLLYLTLLPYLPK